MAPTVLLYQPQNLINVGSVVRAARNCGAAGVRVFQPGDWEIDRILVSAPRCESWVESHVTVHSEWDSFLANVDVVVGVTGHARRERNRVGEFPRDIRADSWGDRSVGLMFGREDHGLTNDAADRCQLLVTIPTDPDYPSLNLAQAVLLTLHQSWMNSARSAETQSASTPPFPPAGADTIERFMQTVTDALDAIGYFKGTHRTNVVRTIRRVVLNADPDTQELATLWGVFRELLRLHPPSAAKSGSDD